MKAISQQKTSKPILQNLPNPLYLIVYIMSVFALVCEIVFPANNRREQLTIKQINGCEIKSGWEAMTDTAKIILPRNVVDFKKREITELFRRGDKVVISLGYNGELNEEFRGYISEVSSDIPVEIMCEDEMFTLKRGKISKSWSNVKLAEVVRYVSGNAYTVDAMDVTLGKVLFEKLTPAKCLQVLKDKMGLYSYFKADAAGTLTLVCGKVYTDDATQVKYDLLRNVVSDELKWRLADDLLIKVTAVSYLSTGEKKEVSVGDEDGEENTLSYYGITDTSELKKMADNDLARLKVDGYAGMLTAFGLPFIKHGYRAELVSAFYPERDGIYYIDSITTTYSDEPSIRRDVEIGPRQI